MSSVPARAAAHPPATPEHTPKRPWWPWLKRALTLLFFGLVTWLLVHQARQIEWGEVLDSARSLPGTHLTIAAALAALSYAVYCTYDLLGRHYTGHTLGRAQVLLVTFISYAFNLNMGSLIGGVGFRIRMYSKLGLDSGTIGRVLSLSLVTNWLGYLLLAGAVFLLRPLDLPPDWKIDSGGLRLLGAALLAVALAYLALCAFSSKRSFTVRGHTLELPSLRFALLQMTLSAINWLLIATIVHTLLQQRIDFPTVLSVMLIAAVAGVITHVPAGLGVLEAVFVALLSHRVPQGDLLAALLTYRAFYYLGPLVLATIAFIVVEARAKKLGAPASPAQPG